jgi:hypothetical protein
VVRVGVLDLIPELSATHELASFCAANAASKAVPYTIAAICEKRPPVVLGDNTMSCFDLESGGGRRVSHP